MKWITVLPIYFLLTGCVVYNTDVVEYQQVVVVSPPVPRLLTVVDDYPVDVTMTTTPTTIDCY